MGRLGRRGLLIAGTGALAGLTGLTGCSGSSTAPTGGVQPSAGAEGGGSAGASSSVATAPRTPTVALPSVRVWTPGAGEIEPAAKRVAVAAVQDLLRPRGTRGVVEVIDAQYGGILSDTASVLVPCRVYTISGGHVLTSGTTVDVRLTKTRGTWRVTATHPAQPGKAAAHLSSAARQVLASDRITLPPASAADIRSGQVHDSVLNTMLQLAKTYRIGISVIRSGHPIDVFGTNRPSDHPKGRAFDTWQLNGHTVVSPSTSRSLITSYMHAAATLGSYNVGGPYQLRPHLLLRPNPPRPHPHRLPHLTPHHLTSTLTPGTRRGTHPGHSPRHSPRALTPGAHSASSPRS
jgi:hypothetical protein